MTTAQEYAPPDTPLAELYVDADILLLDKPSGLLSVPGKGAHLADCLVSRAQSKYPDVLLVHRLDRDTSGVMIFARNKAAQRHLGLQFEKRRIDKTYIARIWGHLSERKGVVDLPLRTDWPNRPKQMVDHVSGKQALTEWEVIEECRTTSRVVLFPKTGRSHQLRVHMAALGCPILGDPFYAEGAASTAPRLMLHAESIGFRHPNGGAEHRVSTPCPF